MRFYSERGVSKPIKSLFLSSIRKSVNQSISQSISQIKHYSPIHHFYFRKTAGNIADKTARAIVKASKQAAIKQTRERIDMMTCRQSILQVTRSCLFGNASSALAFVTLAAVSFTSARSAPAACESITIVL